ncbi:MAG: HIRAN domain-containing protein [Acidiferrobacter sp.]
MKALFIAWQDPKTRRWVPVGRLTYGDGTYKFVYTQGAKESKDFTPFGRMSNLEVAYVSDVLFPLFANRLLPKTRPEYADYLRWLGLSEQAYNELEVLARSGGSRGTDTLEMFPCAEPTADKRYEVFFFSHGLRHLILQNQVRVNGLVPGERLFLVRDVQNEHDVMALMLRTNDPVSVVGYCPRYYSGEFSRLLDLVAPAQVHVSVGQVNRDAPMQLRLLCKLSAPWPPNFSACSTGQFQPIVS